MDIILFPGLVLVIFIIAAIYVSARTVGQVHDYQDEDNDNIPQKDCPECGQRYDIDHPICPFCLCQNDADRILQTVCPECEGSHDMDYPVCPFCGHRYIRDEESFLTKKEPEPPQKDCAECGATHDADYHTCPFCEYKHN